MIKIQKEKKYKIVLCCLELFMSIFFLIISKLLFPMVIFTIVISIILFISFLYSLVELLNEKKKEN